MVLCMLYIYIQLFTQVRPEVWMFTQVLAEVWLFTQVQPEVSKNIHYSIKCSSITSTTTSNDEVQEVGSYIVTEHITVDIAIQLII